jgi:type IV secretion system protein VirD4
MLATARIQGGSTHTKIITIFMTKFLATQPAKPYTLEGALGKLATPQFIGPIVGVILILIAVKVIESRHKPLANARWANWFEIRSCRRQAAKQMREKIPHKIAGAIGSDFQYMFPSLGPGCKVVGKSGGGKTETIIAPLIDDFAAQGATMLVYDAKGDLTRRHAPILKAMGYEVFCFPHDGINLLEYMKDGDDADGAYEVINTIHENLATKGRSEDPFFGKQGKTALKTPCLLAKNSPYPDLLTVFSFISLQNYAARLNAAKENFALGTWESLATTGLRSVANAAQTSAGIIASAVTNIQDLMSEKSIQSVIYNDIPMRLDGKKVVFFQVDKDRPAMSKPIIAAAIDLITRSSCGSETKRTSPFIFIDDEAASITLPNLGHWLAEYRSYGFLAVLGYQNEAQMLMRMTQAEITSNAANMGTTIYFEPNDAATSKAISDRCGMTTVKIREDKRWVQHIVPLIRSEQVELMQPGECIVFGPGTKKRPLKTKIRLNKKDIRRRDAAENVWYEEMLPFYEARTAQRLLDNPLKEIAIPDREAIADCLLPSVEDFKRMQQLTKV